MRYALWVAVATVLLAGPALAGPITVDFDPSSSVVNVGDTFSVSLLADIPDPVLGFGLDLSFDTTVLAQDSLAIGPLWLPATSPDGDGLAGLAFPALSGSDVLLATLSFTAIGVGRSALTASYTMGDLTEGFPLTFPAPPGSFAAVDFVDGLVSVRGGGPVVPEPASLALFGVGLAGLAAASRRKISKRNLS